MVGYNGNTWTDEQLARMAELVDACAAQGKRPGWNSIAFELGHSSASCQQMMSRIRVKRRHEETRQQLREIRAKSARRVLVPAKPAKPIPPTKSDEYNRATSTAKFAMHAELRARISELGVTGGMLGDPAPGRSALDKRLAGIIEPPAAVDHRTAYLASRPKVTLPREPWR